MPDVELKMAFNPDSGEVEVLIDNEVLMTSGAAEFQSWVDYTNEKNKPVAPVVPEPVVVPPAEPTPVVPEVTPEVDKPAEPVVD